MTGIISAIAVMAAALEGRDAVVMSNEWSASVPTVQAGDHAVNHQYSKSAAFEAAFRDVLAETSAGLPAGAAMPDYFSALRPRTELWIAERFARLQQYHGTFRSCNRAFHIDQAQAARPLVRAVRQVLLHRPDPGAVPAGRGRSAAIFGGRRAARRSGPGRPVPRAARRRRPQQAVRMRRRGQRVPRGAAARGPARRPRPAFPLLHELAAEVRALPGRPSTDGLLQPVGEHFIPAPYAEELLA